MINMTKRLRQRSDRRVTHSAAHYMVAVRDLLERQGYARVSDIARELELTPGSVSVAMQSLQASGYVTRDSNRFFTLTDEGEQMVRALRARHEILERFLHEVLSLPADLAHREGCRAEHLVETPTARSLLALLRFWRKQGLDGAIEAELAEGCPAHDGRRMENCPCGDLVCLDLASEQARLASRRPKRRRR